MKKIWQYVLITGVVFMMSLPAVVQADEVSLAEFQDLSIRYTVLLDAEDVTAQLQALTHEQWLSLYDQTPSKAELAKAVIEVERLTREAADKAGKSVEMLIVPRAIAPNVTVAGEFEPRYPDVDPASISCITSATSCYAHYISIAKLLGFFIPDTGESGVQDDRCNEHTEAVHRSIHLNRHEGAIFAQVACDLSSLGAELVTCPAAGAAWALDNLSEELLTVCEVHAGNVDGAEIESAYENTRTILNEANGMKAILGDEKNFTDDTELAVHDIAIKGTISTHDTEIKEQLTLIQDQLTQQQTQLDEIIRLLNTPQGRRPDWNR